MLEQCHRDCLGHTVLPSTTPLLGQTGLAGLAQAGVRQKAGQFPRRARHVQAADHQTSLLTVDHVNESILAMGSVIVIEDGALAVDEASDDGLQRFQGLREGALAEEPRLLWAYVNVCKVRKDLCSLLLGRKERCCSALGAFSSSFS